MIDFNLLRKGISKISGETGVSFETVLGTATSVLAQNLGEDESRNMLDAALTLFSETDLDSQESVDAISAVITNYVSDNVTPQEIIERLNQVKNNKEETNDLTSLVNGLSQTSLVAASQGTDLSSLIQLLLDSKATSSKDFGMVKSILSQLQTPDIIDSLALSGVKTNRKHGLLKKLGAIAFSVLEARTGIDVSDVADLLIGDRRKDSVSLMSNILSSYNIGGNLTTDIPVRQQIANDLRNLARKYDI